MATPLQDNRIILHARDGRQLVFNERSTGRVSAILTDEAGQVIQASQLTALRLWLHLRDEPTQPAAGINDVSNTDILNDGVRGAIGNSQAISGITLTAEQRIRLTVAGHGLANGDLVAVRTVEGLRGANGDWPVMVVGANTLELLGPTGTGTYTSGGTVTKGLHLTLQPADNALVQTSAVPVGAWEWHEASLVATYAAGQQLSFVVHFPVRNLGHAS